MVQNTLNPKVMLMRDLPPHTLSETQWISDRPHPHNRSIVDDVGFAFATSGEGPYTRIPSGGAHAQYWLKMLEGLALCNEMRHYYEHTQGNQSQHTSRVYFPRISLV